MKSKKEVLIHVIKSNHTLSAKNRKVVTTKMIVNLEEPVVFANRTVLMPVFEDDNVAFLTNSDLRVMREAFTDYCFN